MILNNKTQEALKRLINVLDEQDLSIELLVLNTRLENLNQKIRLGIIDEKERTIEENKINHSAISLIKKIDFLEVDLDTEQIRNERKLISKVPFEEIGEERVKKQKRSNLLPYFISLPILILGLIWVVRSDFLTPKEVDCFDLLQIRNSTNRIACEAQQFDKVYYKSISGFIVSFEKTKKDSSKNDIFLEVTILFEKDYIKNGSDSLDAYINENLLFSSGNLHLNYEKGGESYIFTKYDRYYHNRKTVNVVYTSDPLNKLLVEQLRRKNFSNISFFNSMFSLYPSMQTTLFDAIDNEEALSSLSDAVKCLIKYEY